MGKSSTEALGIIKVYGGGRRVEGRPAGDRDFFARTKKQKNGKSDILTADTDSENLYHTAAPCNSVQCFKGSERPANTQEEY